MATSRQRPQQKVLLCVSSSPGSIYHLGRTLKQMGREVGVWGGEVGGGRLEGGQGLNIHGPWNDLLFRSFISDYGNTVGG